MHSQIYSGLSLIFAMLRNCRVVSAKGFFCVRLLRPPGVFSGRKTTKIVHVLQKITKITFRLAY